jgi:hypothetical protein
VGVRGFALKAFAIVLVVALAVVMVVRFDTVTANMSVNIDYYSSSDLSGYEVGTFVKNNFGVNDTGVTTQKPGNWLTMYSGRTILAQTHPTVDYSYNANCVLDLSYEITQPVTTLKVYDSKAVSDANFVFHNLVWQQGTYFEGDDAYLQYRDPNGTLVIIPLSSMQRTVSFNEVDWPKNITITYDDPRATLTQTMLVANTSYAVTVTWALMSKQTLNFVTLSLYEHMDTTLLYNKANIPGLLSWANPLENATKSEPGQWAVTEFNRENMYENSTIDIYDQEDQIGFALKFVDVPAFGNVGALAANGKIDAVRWQYDVYQLIPGYGVTVKYQTLNFAMDNVAQLEDPQQMDSLFDLQVEPFTVECRDFPSIISEEQIRFIVYDVTQFDPKILGSRWLQLVFANNEFVVLTIKDSHPTVNVLYNCTD